MMDWPRWLQPGGGSNLRGLALVAMPCLLLAGSPLHAQSGVKNESIGNEAVDLVTQPLSDLNLRSKDIPVILILAQHSPYDLSELEDCAMLRAEIARLEDVLGPDADAPAEGKGLLGAGLETGGKMLGGLIPFRGLVRQLSGAKAAEKRWEAAIYAGVARRSFLKGVQVGKQCETELSVADPSAREILGLPAEK